MKFYRHHDDGRCLNGSCMLDYPNENLTREQVVAMFGEPAKGAYYEPERGYDGDEYIFISDKIGPSGQNVEVNLYARWGVFRLGGYDHADVQVFKSWLSDRVAELKDKANGST